MDTIDIKSELHKFIDNIKDINLLKAIYVILEKNAGKDFYDDLPEYVISGINESIEDIEKGNVYSHEDVLNDIEEKYNVKL